MHFYSFYYSTTLFVQFQISWVHQLLSGAEYLAERQIIHRDFKSLNILLNSSLTILKIADFGAVTTDVDVAPSLASLASVNGTGSLVGTPRWMSPEILDTTGKCSLSSDAYAVGTIIVEIMTKKMPYAGLNDVQCNTKKLTMRQNALDFYYEANGVTPGGPGSLQPTLELVVQALLSDDPLLRPSLATAAAVLGVSNHKRTTVQTMILQSNFRVQQQTRCLRSEGASRPLFDVVCDIKESLGMEDMPMAALVAEAMTQLQMQLGGTPTLKEKAFAVASELGISTVLPPVGQHL
jgi:serine/threonine protein kinase